ncbi:hypothetical protein XU06_29360 (plasmid) [Rhodococcus erythropolis]|uniref:MFS transporter n=1 Tax=Rhodococcus erythropolis TaxID=1833 RepID=UPI00061B6DAE|nr:MFS transporter [Rhodococcus erythropolis]AKE01092.1 hypothetical protein XU06_29360 [Rhodococcus erythropolis]
MTSVLLLAGLITDVQGGGMFAPLLGTIMSERNISSADVGWIINAGIVGAVVSIGLTASLGDRFGHRRVLLILSGLAIVGSLLAAVSTSFGILLLGRFLSGVAVALPFGWGMVRARATAPQVQTIALVMSVTTALFAQGSIILGSLFLEIGLPWESVLWLLFGLYVALFVLTALSPETPREAHNRDPIDFTGAIGLGVWVTAILVGISEGPTRGWTSPFILGAFLLGAVVLVAWIIQQRLVPAPVVSFENMDVRQTLIGLSAINFLAIVVTTVGVALPTILQTPSVSGFGYGMSPFESTLPLLGVLTGAALSSLLVRRLLPRFGPRIVLVGAATAAVIAPLGLAFFHAAYWQFFVWTFAQGITMVTVWTVGFALVSAAARRDNTAVVFGLQGISMFLTIAIVSAVTYNFATPGPDGWVTESTWQSLLVGVACIALFFAVLWFLVAPRQLIDRHAVPGGEPAVERDINGAAVSLGEHSATNRMKTTP